MTLELSAKEDKLGGMTNTPNPLIDEIEAFLARFPMGESYFGKRAVGNSEVVARLRSGGRVWPETEQALRAFMASKTEGAAQ
jgi:hypothetical protein